jgi:glycosyltransferase involved in cell wall biosynthesis
MRPLVSILVTTYNHEKYILEALESALAQDYRPLQIVVSDDGSTDATAAIVDRFSREHPNEVVAFTGPHVGLVANANQAFSACKGEFIAILDGDDVYLPGKISAQVAWFDQNRDGVLCGHDVEHFDASTGQTLVRHFAARPPFAGRGPGPFLELGSPFATVSVMFRRASAPSTGFDARLSSALDYKLWLDCLANNGTFGFVDKQLARYRVHQSGLTATRQTRIQTDVSIARAIFETEQPENVPRILRGRAGNAYERAYIAFRDGNHTLASKLARAALAYSPLAVPKATILLLLTKLPRALRNLVSRRLLRANPVAGTSTKRSVT